MKNQDFKDFLFKSAVMVMACDGEIAEEEIIEIKNIVSKEIYFMGYEYEDQLKINIENIKANGASVINEYIQELALLDLSEQQVLILIEVLIRMIEADKEIKQSEVKFLQIVKSKFKIEEQTLIVKFPKQIDYLIDFNNYGLNDEFNDEIDIITN